MSQEITDPVWVAHPDWIAKLEEYRKDPLLFAEDMGIPVPACAQYNGLQLIESDLLEDGTAVCVSRAAFKHRPLHFDPPKKSEYEYTYRWYMGIDLAKNPYYLGTMPAAIALENVGDKFVLLGYFKRLWLNIKGTFRVAWLQMNRDYKELINDL